MRNSPGGAVELHARSRVSVFSANASSFARKSKMAAAARGGIMPQEHKLRKENHSLMASRGWRRDNLWPSGLLTRVQAPCIVRRDALLKVGSAGHGTGPFQIAVGPGLFCPARSRRSFLPNSFLAFVHCCIRRSSCAPTAYSC